MDRLSESCASGPAQAGIEKNGRGGRRQQSPDLPDLCADLPEPTADAARELRTSAGLSLAGMSAAAGLADRQTWARYERGAAIDPRAWALAHLALGRHPAYTLKSRSEA